MTLHWEYIKEILQIWTLIAFVVVLGGGLLGIGEELEDSKVGTIIVFILGLPVLLPFCIFLFMYFHIQDKRGKL